MGLLDLVRCVEVFAVDQRVASVLFAAKVAHEGKRIVRLVLVCRGLCRRADDHDREKREAYHYHREAEQHRIGEYLLLLHGPEKSPEAQAQKRCHEECRSAVEAQSERVDEEKVEICGDLRKVRDDSEEDYCKYHDRYGEYLDVLLERVVSVLALLVIVHEHEGRYGKEVQQVDADGKSHDERNQDYPSVRIRRVGLFVPFRHRPEHEGGHKRGHGVYLSFHCGEPECVAECVCEGSHGT